MSGFITGLVVFAVFAFIVSRSDKAKAKVHEWTKPKPGGVNEQK